MRRLSETGRATAFCPLCQRRPRRPRRPRQSSL
ncbi:MAG: hypothetical protein M3337_07390 [Actinomycetota bacterium]|nr:hypothetical protein [Actinomycetota bacterium]